MFLNKNNLHHAYLLEGEKELIFKELLSFLKEDLKISVIANPDFYLREFNTFKIDNAREIKNFQSRKNIAGNKQIIIIQTNFITIEAQNSLLKMFEEPTENTHIFLITYSSEIFLPTIKSRLQLIKVLNKGDSNEKDFVDRFLKSSISKRTELMKEFLPKTSKEKANKVGAVNFLNNLEMILYKKYKEKSLDSLPPEDYDLIFEEIFKSRSYLSDRSPSTKMILEHISQITPRI